MTINSQRLLLLCVFTIATACSLVAADAEGQATSTRTPRTREQMTIAVEAHRREGLHAAARVTGEYRIVEPFVHGGSGVATDLATIVVASDLVVIGRPLDNRSVLSRDERTITTEYLVQVSEVLRDTDDVLRGHAPIVVSLPGGRVEFGDGTAAQIDTPGFHKMQDGNRYFLALSLDPSEPPDGLPPGHLGHGRYQLTGGSQGLFEVPEDGRPVQASGPGKSLLAKEFHGASVEQFVQRGRDAAQKANKDFPKGRKRGQQ